jgi:uncharacterized protein YcfJ
MNNMFKTMVGIAGMAIAMQSAAEVTFYEREGFRGRSFTTDRPVRNLDRQGFNDRASSAVVQSGEWQVCEDAGFNGHCVVLRPGEYPSLGAMGLNNDISSVREADGRQAYGRDDRGYGVAQGREGDYRRRADERLFEARVTSVRAVVGPPEQRCWVERQQLAGPDRGDPNVGGAIVGGVLGGILGHQIGSGRGQDAATIGGAVAGAAIGANTGRGGVVSQDVQRCTTVPRNARPDFYDVTYEFRGQTHHVQMAAPPGPTILVNRDGEPRV